jgi:hypothetical protein
MITAIALANDLPLHTCNPRDFTGIEGLTVVAVPRSDHESTPSETGRSSAHSGCHHNRGEEAL